MVRMAAAVRVQRLYALCHVRHEKSVRSRQVRTLLATTRRSR